MLYILMLTACTTQMPNDGSGAYSWSGFVYSDIPADSGTALTDGTIEVRNTQNDIIAEGVQTDPDNPGNWQIPVTAAEAVAIRISGPEQLTTVWRADTPTATAYWFAGTFFAVKTETILPFWDGLTEMTEVPQATTDGVHLYGEPLALNEEDLEAWTGAQINIYDGAGVIHPAISLTTTSEGLMELATEQNGPITAFTAVDLAPGEIRLVIDASDGRTMVMDYFAEPGDLLSAFAFTLPTQ